MDRSRQRRPAVRRPVLLRRGRLRHVRHAGQGLPRHPGPHHDGDHRLPSHAGHEQRPGHGLVQAGWRDLSAGGVLEPPGRRDRRPSDPERRRFLHRLDDARGHARRDGLPKRPSRGGVVRDRSAQHAQLRDPGQGRRHRRHRVGHGRQGDVQQLHRGRARALRRHQLQGRPLRRVQEHLPRTADHRPRQGLAGRRGRGLDPGRHACRRLPAPPAADDGEPGRLHGRAAGPGHPRPARRACGRHDPGPRAGSLLPAVRPLSDDHRIARRPADQPAGSVGRQQRAPVVRRLPQRRQHRDELLVARPGRPARVLRPPTSTTSTPRTPRTSPRSTRCSRAPASSGRRGSSR